MGLFPYIHMHVYMYMRKVCLAQPYTRTRLTDERMDGRTDRQTYPHYHKYRYCSGHLQFIESSLDPLI